MNKLKIARHIVTFSTDVGAEIAVSNIIRSIVPMHSRLPIRICQHMGRFGLMMAGGSLAAKYAGETFDVLVGAVKDDTPTLKAFNLN